MVRGRMVKNRAMLDRLSEAVRAGRPLDLRPNRQSPISARNRRRWGGGAAGRGRVGG